MPGFDKCEVWPHEKHGKSSFSATLELPMQNAENFETGTVAYWGGGVSSRGWDLFPFIGWYPKRVHHVCPKMYFPTLQTCMVCGMGVFPRREIVLRVLCDRQDRSQHRASPVQTHPEIPPHNTKGVIKGCSVSFIYHISSITIRD